MSAAIKTGRKLKVWVAHNYKEKMEAYGWAPTFDERADATDPAGFEPQEATIIIVAQRGKAKSR